MIVAGPQAIAVIMALGRRERQQRAADIAAGRDVELRRDAAVAGVAPIGLPARLERDLEHALYVAGRVGLAAGDQSDTAAFAVIPCRRGSEGGKGGGGEGGDSAHGKKFEALHAVI